VQSVRPVTRTYCVIIDVWPAVLPGVASDPGSGLDD